MHMPFGNPFGLPIMFGPPPDYHRERPIDRIPARVAVALGIAERISAQMNSRIAGNDISLLEFEARPLEIEERQMLKSSCKVICSYLEGSMEMTTEEQIRLRQQLPIAVAMAKCIACEGVGGNVECGLCGGSGQMKVIPHTLGEPRPSS